MSINFHADDITTNVPTCCLIEDYWILRTAIAALDAGDVYEAKENILTAMNCLEESIDRFTMVRPDLQIRPSVFSAIAMSHESGIIMHGDEDLRCIKGHPLSDAGMSYCNCEECPFRIDGGCDPEEGSILLEGGVRYKAWSYPEGVDEGEFLKAMEKDGDPV